MSTMNRRRFLTASLLIAASGLGTRAIASASPLGTVIDFAAGVPSAQAIKKAGHVGAVRYVSQPRPGAAWMLGKPVTLKETRANAGLGLATASVYQFGKEETADWKQGAAGALVHAPQAIALHVAAGGPKGKPIYVAIDDNPTRAQYENQIRPYLREFARLLKVSGYQMGIYANYYTIDWAVRDGLGTHYWQHDWGSNGLVHSRANIHQRAGRQATIDGVLVDINDVLKPDWGQWKPVFLGS